MMSTADVTLPHGIRVDGSWYRTAALRPLNGLDEAFMLEEAGGLLPAHRTTALLSRALSRLGSLEPVPSEWVSRLTIGDREALLLQLRRLTLGDRLDCVLSCPNPSCGEKMDLELQVSDFILAPYGYEQMRHEHVVRDDAGQYCVRFRLPTGADQEAAARLALDDVEAAVNLVLQRCIEEIVVQDETESFISAMPEAVAQAMPFVLSELDPQAEVRFSLRCPGCGQGFDQLFDTGDYFFRELSGRRHDLYRDVHLLALHYHWSEAEIMAMTRRKRRLYLGLLAEAMSMEKAS